MQLSEYEPKFNAMGINVLTITYDSHKDAKKFFERNNLSFPILRDDQSTLIKSLGILNVGPQPGDSAYGIPYPGMFLVDKEGNISAKFAEQSFKERPNYNAILGAAHSLTQ